MTHHNRFFVPATAIKGNLATLSGAVVHQIKNVLRLRPGDRLTLLDNSGWRYDVEITDLDHDLLLGAVHGKALVTTEPRTKVTIYQGLLRGQQFEFVLQKATEVGVSVIVPTICQRCLVANLSDAGARKLSRWERIIAEAAEQSGRGKIPALRPALLFQQACEQVRGLSLLPWEDEDSVSLREALRREANLLALKSTNGGYEPSARELGPHRPFSVNLFIGPEGGFTPEELAMARGYGITTVTLGPRLLRAETAALVAASLVLHELGDMGR